MAELPPVQPLLREAGTYAQGVWRTTVALGRQGKQALGHADEAITGYVKAHGGEDLGLKAYGKAAKHFAKNKPVTAAAIVGGTVTGSVVAATSVLGDHSQRYANEQSYGRSR